MDNVHFPSVTHFSVRDTKLTIVFKENHLSIFLNFWHELFLGAVVREYEVSSKLSN